MKDKEEESQLKRPQASGFVAAEWRKVDLAREAFMPREEFRGSKFVSFRPRHATFLSIFLELLPTDLLLSIWEANSWTYEGGKERVFGGQFDLCNIYKFLAIKIRVQGIHMAPERNKLNGKALDRAMSEASCHFQSLFPHCPPPPGRNIRCVLSSRFLIDFHFFDRLSASFQALIFELGEFTSGDEKLDHFTGLSGDLRHVKNKPAQIGLWHYELVGKVNNKTAYLMDFHLAHPHTQVSESDIMALVVERWCRIIHHLNRYLPRKYTALCFDSHYMDNSSRTVALRENCPYSGSVKSGRFGPVFDMVKEDVKRPGDFSCVYNSNTNELFTYYFDKNPHLGRKMVMSNVLEHIPGRKHPKSNVPAYTAHGIMFNGCDIFNNALCGRMWPHKKGGGDVLGDAGKQDDFAFTSLLLNTWNATRTIMNDTFDNDDFLSFCTTLSDDLYCHACTI